MKRFTILLAVLAFLLLRKRSRPEEAPPEPPPPRPTEISLSLSDENFEKWRDFIQPKAEELAWEEIGWRTTLWGGLVEAQAAQRPVLLQVRGGLALGLSWSGAATGRKLVWSDFLVRHLASSFVPIADEDGLLRYADSEEGRFYRALLGEIDRFAGASGDLPSPALLDLQGIYCFTPSGTLLAAARSSDPREVAAALKEALSKWDLLDPKKRLSRWPIRPFDATLRPEPPYPEDGLVLLQSMRDLPRIPPQEPGFAGAWNKDYVWFKKSEARLLLPEKIQRGARYEVPGKLVKRLVTVHFVDQVRGASEPFELQDVDGARLTATVEDLEGMVARLRFEGSSRAAREGRWPVDGERDLAWPIPQKRGMELSLLGRACYDLKSQRFIAFELVAIGRRWGGTQWNGRAADLADGPIGFAFAVAPGHPVHRAAPYALASWGRTYWME